MKLARLFSGVVATVALSLVSSQALTLNFSSTQGATIQFNGTGDSFQFNGSPIYTGTQWQIGSENDGTGSAVGLFGLVDNGPFSYGPVTTVTLPGLDYEYATVGVGETGGLQINDGAGYTLTGNVDWIQVATYNYAGAINGQLAVNVKDLAYGGANADLQALVANAPASMSLTFQFAPGMTLSQLSSGNGPYTTSYSGSLHVVPEPSALTLALVGLVVCGFAVTYRGRAKPAVQRKRQDRV